MSTTSARIPAIELPLTPQLAEQQAARNLSRLNSTPTLGLLRIEFMDALRLSIAPKARMKKLLKIADQIAAVAAPHSACRSGCSYCCHTAVAVTQIEAQIIGEETGIKPLKSEHRMSRAETAHYHRQPCPFLSQGACSIYSVRPVACRLMINLADSPYYCNTDIEPQDSHVTQLNLHELEFAYAGTFMSSGFADIRDFFPNGKQKRQKR